jgi:hypothetical protein
MWSSPSRARSEHLVLSKASDKFIAQCNLATRPEYHGSCRSPDLPRSCINVIYGATQHSGYISYCSRYIGSRLDRSVRRIGTACVVLRFPVCHVPLSITLSQLAQTCRRTNFLYFEKHSTTSSQRGIFAAVTQKRLPRSFSHGNRVVAYGSAATIVR